MTIYFTSLIIVPGTLTFGYIQFITNVAFTDSFLDIVLGKYVRLEIGKRLPPKMRNESDVTAFLGGFGKYCPWCYVCLIKNERLKWETS